MRCFVNEGCRCLDQASMPTFSVSCSARNEIVLVRNAPLDVAHRAVNMLPQNSYPMQKKDRQFGRQLREPYAETFGTR